MSPRSFNELVNLLRVDLLPKNIARARSDFIDPEANPEAKLMLTLQWLAGRQYIDQCQKHGISEPTFFRCIAQMVNAINKNQQWLSKMARVCLLQSATRMGMSGQNKGLLTMLIGLLGWTSHFNRTAHPKGVHISYRLTIIFQATRSKMV
jgi:hypothetical protein